MIVAQKLRAVSFPRDCLSWFKSIASINTAQNRETCGLLLGKDKGRSYVVTTLLIPKQHATSDTCVIDKEELLTKFTEERSLITLGWVCRHLCWWTRGQCSLVRYCQIHTHPMQSCVCFVEMLGRAMANLIWGHKGFMSSVDLHTHSGFQRMLPESVAVVCAPNSIPEYVF